MILIIWNFKAKAETTEQVIDVAPVATEESTSVEEPVAVVAEANSEETDASVKVFLDLINKRPEPFSTSLWRQRNLSCLLSL